MELVHVDGRVNGWYHYPGKSIKLKLNGTLTSNNHIKLFESNHKGNVTGVFEGDITELGEIVGNWTSPNKSKVLTFSFLLKSGPRIYNDLRSNTDSKSEEESSESENGQFSNHFLILMIFVGGAILLAFIKLNGRKKIKGKPSVIHTKEVQVHYVQDTKEFDADLQKNKGKMFEKYVAQLFLNKKENFIWINQNSDTMIGEHYPKSNLDPDLIFEFRKNGGVKQKIGVECKYRTGHNKELVQIGEQRQIDNYLRFQKENQIPTFLVLGIGGSPNMPDKKYSIPVLKVKPTMTLFELDVFESKRDYFFFDYEKKTLN